MLGPSIFSADLWHVVTETYLGTRIFLWQKGRGQDVALAELVKSVCCVFVDFFFFLNIYIHIFSRVALHCPLPLPPVVLGIAATFKCSKSSDVSVLSPVCFAEGGNEDRLPLWRMMAPSRGSCPILSGRHSPQCAVWLCLFLWLCFSPLFFFSLSLYLHLWHGEKGPLRLG